MRLKGTFAVIKLIQKKEHEVHKETQSSRRKRVEEDIMPAEVPHFSKVKLMIPEVDKSYNLFIFRECREVTPYL